MQRTGRKGFATFRVVVQDSRFTPTSGRVVAQVGHSNPHTKETVLDVDKIREYLKNGAQPTPRVVRLLQAEKIELPSWVKLPSNEKNRKTKNTDKLRKHQPKEEIIEEPAEEPAPVAEEATVEETPEAETPPVEKPAEETEAPESEDLKEESLAKD